MVPDAVMGERTCCLVRNAKCLWLLSDIVGPEPRLDAEHILLWLGRWPSKQRRNPLSCGVSVTTDILAWPRAGTKERRKP
jgi:hypothetical protein